MFFVSCDAAVERLYQSYTTRSAASLATFIPRTIDSAFWKSCKNAALILVDSCCIFTLAVRQPPVLASCIEIYYCQFQSFARLIDRKERNFRMRLEIKGKKIGEKKQFIIFLSLERPFNINIINCNFIRSLGIGKWDKIGSESSENAKKRDFSIFKFIERPLNIFCPAKYFARSIIWPKGTKFSGETKN